LDKASVTATTAMGLPRSGTPKACSDMQDRLAHSTDASTRSPAWHREPLQAPDPVRRLRLDRRSTFARRAPAP
jgi:hypothetical protein